MNSAKLKYFRSLCSQPNKPSTSEFCTTKTGYWSATGALNKTSVSHCMALKRLPPSKRNSCLP